MRSEKPANGSHFPTAFEASKGTPFNSKFVERARLSCVNPLRQQRRTRWHSPESEDIWLFGEGKLVLLCVWWQLLDELRGQVTQPAVWDPEFVFTTAAKRANEELRIFFQRLCNLIFFFLWATEFRLPDTFFFSLFAVSESHEIQPWHTRFEWSETTFTNNVKGIFHPALQFHPFTDHPHVNGGSRDIF